MAEVNKNEFGDETEPFVEEGEGGTPFAGGIESGTPSAAKKKVTSVSYDYNQLFEARLKELEPKINKIVNNTTKEYIKNLEYKLTENIKSKIKSLDESKIEIVEILSIFVALFTFVSVDIQIFKSQDVSFLSATGTALITLGALLIFVLALHISLNKTAKYSKKRWLFSIIIPIIMIGTGVYLIQEDFNSYTKIITDLNNRVIQNIDALNNLKKCFKSGGWDKCFE